MSQNTMRVSVVGATGYTGAELLRLLAGHPNVELAKVCGQSTAGRPIAEVLPTFAGVLQGDVEAFDAHDVVAASDAVFCALPHAASAEIVDALRQRGATVFDLSADFRFEDQALYETWYGAHPVPARLSEAVYGLVELHRDALRGADLIAVPGCYPTSAILAVAPLLKDGLAKPDGIIVDAKSGVSGAGRTARMSTHLPETAEGVRAYKAGAHRHGPEIQKELQALTSAPVQMTFVPHLMPMTRGILATCYAQPASSNVTAERCTEAARSLYEGSPSVHVLDAGSHPDTLWVRGSNRVHVAYAQDATNGTLIAMAAIDNLVKGAGGQAVQAFNVRFGFPEGAGLDAPAMWP